MAALDRVRELQGQGQNDAGIAKTMQEEGTSPREINDALSQSQIKNAVTQQNIAGAPGTNQPPTQSAQGMTPSMMDSQTPTPNSNLQPMPQQGPYAQEMGEFQPPTQGDAFYDPSQAPAAGQQYQDPYGGQEQPYSSNETVTEIASQIVSQKMRKTSKSVNDLKEVQVLLAAKVEKIDERLNRIEKIIDSLQAILLRKSTEQEQNIADIKTEMEGMQEGFGKVLNPLIDIERSLEKPKRKTSKKKTKKKK